MSNGARASKLFGDLYVIRKGWNARKSKGARVRKQFSEDDLSKLKKEQAMKKEKRREEESTSEKVQLEKDRAVMREIATRSNAGIRHIEVFTNLIEYAITNSLSVTIIEMKKRLKPEDAVKEWRTIRGWCGKNAPKICAITIGRKPKGWWSLRVLVVGGKEDEDCYKPALALHSYLMLKRGWVTSDHAGSQEAKNLEEHYLTRLSSEEETFDQYVPEMYEVYRASLRMPKSTRTYRTKEAFNILEAMNVDPGDIPSLVVNWVGQGCSPSGVALCRVIMKEGRIVGAKMIDKTFDDEDEDDGWFITGDEPMVSEDF